MQYTLTENDIGSFLQVAPRPATRFISTALILVLIAVLIWGGKTVLVPNTTTTFAAPVTTTHTLSTPPISTASIAPTPTPLPVTIPNNTFSSADLGISAPISWRVPLDQNTMNDALVHGLIQIDGTALPGQQGMIAIAGHSSNYPWIKSDYNSVFAPLTKAKIGDIFLVNYNNVMYQYTVNKIYQVEPNDVSVLSSDGTSGLRLITCVPVGTSLHRLIVETTQTFPDPTQNSPFTSSTFSGQLPSGQ